MQSVGIQSLITLTTYFIFIGISFWSIQEIHLERYLPMKAYQGKTLIVLLSVVVGFTTSNFFLSFIDNIRNLIFIMK